MPCDDDQQDDPDSRPYPALRAFEKKLDDYEVRVEPMRALVSKIESAAPVTPAILRVFDAEIAGLHREVRKLAKESQRREAKGEDVEAPVALALALFRTDRALNALAREMDGYKGERAKYEAAAKRVAKAKKPASRGRP